MRHIFRYARVSTEQQNLNRQLDAFTKYGVDMIYNEKTTGPQNRACEQDGPDIRVSHESLEAQGIRDREPTNHLRLVDWQREKRGERTAGGDLRREIEARSKERARQSQLRRQRSLERFR